MCGPLIIAMMQAYAQPNDRFHAVHAEIERSETFEKWAVFGVGSKSGR